MNQKQKYLSLRGVKMNSLCPSARFTPRSSVLHIKAFPKVMFVSFSAHHTGVQLEADQDHLAQAVLDQICCFDLLFGLIGCVLICLKNHTEEVNAPSS